MPPSPITPRRMSALLTLPWIGLTSATCAVDFSTEIRPIFEKHCTECHGEKKQKSGLRLDVREAALKGGDSGGPVLIPGNARSSPLMHLITSSNAEEMMPPEGARLSKEEVATLAAWIDGGAVWPDGVDLVKLKDKREHWSFKPLTVSPGEHSVDAFIQAKLREHGLELSPPADRTSLLRRVTLDLTGLPPTPEQAAAFLEDTRNEAFETVVDALLNSPRYGERWAQHWLDVVRYADTHGFEVNTERPNAWPYRDYVIDAFNADTPYDQFIREQLAGDALGKDAATGFLVTASVLLPGQIGKDEPSKRLARQDSLDEIIMNIGQTFLGLSVGCARCHDHKFDPISAKDYYAMQAFVSGVEYADREFQTPEAALKRARAKQLREESSTLDRQLARFVPPARSGVTRPMVDPRENSDRFAPVKTKRLRFTILATNSLEPCIDELEVFNAAGENIALSAIVSVSGEKVTPNTHEQRFLNDGNYGNSRSWMSNETGKGWVILEFAQEASVERVVWGRDREGKFKDRLPTSYRIEVYDAAGQWTSIADSEDREPYVARDAKPREFSTKGLSEAEAATAKHLIEEKRRLDRERTNLESALKVFAGVFRQPDEIHLLNRGDPEQPKDEMVPAVLSALGTLTLSRETPEQRRREALAHWIASPENLLTARVMVNRIWQGHFGSGLVQTPSDFGNNGTPPTHPELLDWLAREFIRSGWSVKKMHRLIVLSKTYRQSSRLNPAAALKDSEARLLWRFPTRRLEAETIRDSILAVSAQLNLKMYGRGFDLFDKRGGLSGFNPVETFTPENQRRMIYSHKVRREPETVFGAFDCPDAGQSTATRRASTTPIQALNLFNSRFSLAHAEAFANRVVREAENEPRAQIRHAYQLALNREPSREEAQDAEPVLREHGPATLCRALLNSNEFLFLP